MIGLIRQPKYGHLKELHKAIKLCERALVNADPTVISLGNYEKVCCVLYTKGVEATSRMTSSKLSKIDFSTKQLQLQLHLNILFLILVILRLPN